MPGYRYAVIGAGRQGTAAAYDLAVRGEAAAILLADTDERQARAAADRVNGLAGGNLAAGVGLDAADVTAVTGFLRPVDAAVSAVPYGLNLGITLAALEAGTHLCDLGGHRGIVSRQLDMDDEARRAGVSVIPDCGEAPGMANNVTARAADLLDRTDELTLYDGGIPVDPQPPWNYVLTFNMDGLTTEYDDVVPFVIDQRIVDIEPFAAEHYELVDFGPPIGVLEAFPAGTASTLPHTVGTRVRSMAFKVLRHPGHAAQFKAFRDLGLFARDPIPELGVDVAPRDVFHALIEPQIRAGRHDRDLVIARAVARGTKDGRAAEAVVDVRVHPDERLGFSAMECATGWHAAVVCHLMASGVVEAGATPVEVAVEAGAMLDELRARGFDVTERVPEGVA